MEEDSSAGESSAEDDSDEKKEHDMSSYEQSLNDSDIDTRFKKGRSMINRVQSSLHNQSLMHKSVLNASGVDRSEGDHSPFE